MNYLPIGTQIICVRFKKVNKFFTDRYNINHHEFGECYGHYD